MNRAASEHGTMPESAMKRSQTGKMPMGVASRGCSK